jgi:hypothetical protein
LFGTARPGQPVIFGFDDAGAAGDLPFIGIAAFGTVFMAGDAEVKDSV